MRFRSTSNLQFPDDDEFLWIAEEALCAPLPAGWSEHSRPDDSAVYYYNMHTHESNWHHPMDEYYRTLLGRCVSRAAASRMLLRSRLFACLQLLRVQPQGAQERTQAGAGACVVSVQLSASPPLLLLLSRSRLVAHMALLAVVLAAVGQEPVRGEQDWLEGQRHHEGAQREAGQVRED
eukprot:SAG22_NODE_4035_length_1414_cov_1.105703_2_plen_178_part_00